MSSEKKSEPTKVEGQEQGEQPTRLVWFFVVPLVLVIVLKVLLK